MNILVIGAHFYNKGAHLMMKTVSEKFKNKPNVELFLSPCAGTESQISEVGYSRLDFPLKHVTAYRSFDIFYHFGKLIRFLGKKYQGKIKPSKIDAILDISGFAYSDQWGEKSVVNLNKIIRRYKSYGTKFIFLPQAFGPFKGKKIRNEMLKAINSVDMVAVRDKDSEDMLIKIGASDKIERFPDITIGLKPNDEINAESLVNDFVCIVPNERMLDQGKEFWPEGQYMKYIEITVKELLKRTDLDIYVLVHDNGKGDEEVADRLIEKIGSTQRVIKYFEYDPLRLKAFLGQSKMVVGSRYHALVSALSQNVPCLSLGWSHKYKMLFEEYGIGDYSFDKPNDSKYSQMLDKIIDSVSREHLLQTIKKNNEVLKQKNDEMWRNVFTILEIE